MAKDPAFLFYYQDFLVGTTFMNYEERGAYITLLCFQAAKGPLSEADILKKIPSPIWQAICCKFVCKDGRYLNERLAKEITKRQLYCQNRRENLHMGKHMAKHMKGAMTAHMENENENINNNNVNINNETDISDHDKAKSQWWDKFCALYPRKIGLSLAMATFSRQIKTEKDFNDIMTAVKTYLYSDEVKSGKIKNFDRWMEDWRGWLDMAKKPAREIDKYKVEKK